MARYYNRWRARYYGERGPEAEPKNEMQMWLPLLLLFPALRNQQTSLDALKTGLAGMPVINPGDTTAAINQLNQLKPLLSDVADKAGASTQAQRTMFLIQALTSMSASGSGNSSTMLILILALSSGGGFSF